MSENIQPTHCFCQIPDAELKVWATKRYKEKHSTMELLKSTDNPHDKEVIGIVALLDVDEDSMLEMMGGVDRPKHHIIHCRQNVKQMLEL
jgi:hypothetical protein